MVLLILMLLWLSCDSIMYSDVSVLYTDVSAVIVRVPGVISTDAGV